MYSMAFYVQTLPRLYYIVSLSYVLSGYIVLKPLRRLKTHIILRKYNLVQKEIFMKNRVTKCLVLSALAIRMRSTQTGKNYTKQFFYNLEFIK